MADSANSHRDPCELIIAKKLTNVCYFVCFELTFEQSSASIGSELLLVLLAVRRQRRAMYVIFAIFQRQLYTIIENIPYSRKNRCITNWHKRRPPVIWRPIV